MSLWDVLGGIITIVLTILSWVFAILWWFVSFLVMPLLILAIIAAIGLRVAYRTPLTKPYVERLFAWFGNKSLGWARRLTYAVTVFPLHVLVRFIWFSLLYAWINLWWQPKWTPWERAVKGAQLRSQPKTE